MKIQIGWLIGLSVLISQCLLVSAQVQGVSTNWNRTTNHAPWAARRGMATAAINLAPRNADPEIHTILIGGRHQLSATTSNYFNDIWRSTDGVSWTFVANGPWAARHGGKLASIPQHGPVNQALYFTGGESNGVFYNDIWKSTNNGVTWTPLSVDYRYTPRKEFEFISANHYGGSAGIASVCAYVMGGETATGNIVKEVFYICEGWTQLAFVGNWPFTGRARFGAVTINGGEKIIVVGGQQPGGTLENDVWFWDLAGGGTWKEYAGFKTSPWIEWFPKIMYPVIFASSGPPLSEHNLWVAAGTVIPTSGPDAGKQMPLPHMYGLQHPADRFSALYLYSNPNDNYYRPGQVPSFPVRSGGSSVVNPLNNFVMYFGGSDNETISTSYNDVWTTYLYPLETQDFQY